ncbi:MAG: hypothetical protein P4M11_11860 [Candidatus Pacebacteria bacterium]|nr:hypothetical protein [Candidatus Paceibacterota bacterium]
MLKDNIADFGETSPKMKRSICAPYEPSEFIYIADPETVRTKIAKIRADGPANLNLISGTLSVFSNSCVDFDFTLTRRSFDGHCADSSFKVLSSVPWTGL